MARVASFKSQSEYYDGALAARMVRATTGKIRWRLSTRPDYWQGFHDARPDALRNFNAAMVDDPTRPGGWCIGPLESGD